jgi:TM2 domain-containing membrane protein YozV
MAQADLSPQQAQKNPTIATVLALIVPGAGHFYVRANGRGRGILTTVIVSLALLWWLDLWMLLPLLLPLFPRSPTKSRRCSASRPVG